MKHFHKSATIQEFQFRTAFADVTPLLYHPSPQFLTKRNLVSRLFWSDITGPPFWKKTQVEPFDSREVVVTEFDVITPARAVEGMCSYQIFVPTLQCTYTYGSGEGLRDNINILAGLSLLARSAVEHIKRTSASLVLRYNEIIITTG